MDLLKIIIAIIIAIIIKGIQTIIKFYKASFERRCPTDSHKDFDWLALFEELNPSLEAFKFKTIWINLKDLVRQKLFLMGHFIIM